MNNMMIYVGGIMNNCRIFRYILHLTYSDKSQPKHDKMNELANMSKFIYVYVKLGLVGTNVFLLEFYKYLRTLIKIITIL